QIVEVGSNVHDFAIGDIVSGEGHVVCGRCRNCLAGRRHLCKDTKGVGVNRPGAFAEYISLPMTTVWHHLPPSAHSGRRARDEEAENQPLPSSQGPNNLPPSPLGGRGPAASSAEQVGGDR